MPFFSFTSLSKKSESWGIHSNDIEQYLKDSHDSFSRIDRGSLLRIAIATESLLKESPDCTAGKCGK